MKYRMFARSAGVRVSELALGAGMFERAVEPDATRSAECLRRPGRSIPRHGTRLRKRIIWLVTRCASACHPTRPHWEIITGTVPTPVGIRGA